MRSIRLIQILLACASVNLAAMPADARVCKYRELADIAGEKVTLSARIDQIDPDEDDPAKQIYITLDNSAADHCYAYIAGVPKTAAQKCKAGRIVTATGRVSERFDAWWGLEKISAITCN